MTYLEAHPPARHQYRWPRRMPPSGAIVVHTAENTPDLDGPDGGAEGVARFISTRTDAGSYHTVVDADSIVRVVPYDAEAYGEGTGGNSHALHLSFATRTTTWDDLEPSRLIAMIHNGAKAAADMARWLDPHGKATPALRITAAGYRRGYAGFISHAELDPTRRSDPGASFPWGAFLDRYAQELHMPTTTDRTAIVKTSQQRLADNGATITIDGDWGPESDAALDAVLNYQQGEMAKLTRELAAAVKAREVIYARHAETAAQLEDAIAQIATLQALDAVARRPWPIVAIVQRLNADLAELTDALAKIQR